MMVLDCPKCGHTNIETKHEALHYECEMCQTSYDMVVCNHCQEMVGADFGDEECTLCGELLYNEQ